MDPLNPYRPASETEDASPLPSRATGNRVDEGTRAGACLALAVGGTVQLMVIRSWADWTAALVGLTLLSIAWACYPWRHTVHRLTPTRRDNTPIVPARHSQDDSQP